MRVIKIWSPGQRARRRKTTSLTLLSKKTHCCLQLILSSPPASHLVPSVTDVILALTPVCPPLWSHCPVFFFCGVELFVLGGLFVGGRSTLLLQAASSLSAHHTEHVGPPLFGAEMRCFSRPHGESEFSASVLLELHFKTADRYCVHNLTLPALGRVNKRCVILLCRDVV